MEKFKIKDKLKLDPREGPRTGRPCQFLKRDSEPQINFDALVELGINDRSFAQRHDTHDELEAEGYKSEINSLNKVFGECHSHKYKKTTIKKTPSRQYIRLWLVIFFFLLLVISVGYTIRIPSGRSDTQSKLSRISIQQTTDSVGSASDVLLPPISFPSTRGTDEFIPKNHQKINVLSNLDHSLMLHKREHFNNTRAGTILSGPKTVASNRGNNGEARLQNLVTNMKPPHILQRWPLSLERKQTVIEQKGEVKSKTLARESAKVLPRSTVSSNATVLSAAPVDKSARNLAILKSVCSDNYTLQLCGSSDYFQINNLAKKSNLKDYLVYQTIRNGQPWYVLISGVYGSKDEAKRASSRLPIDVRAKKPWAKPMYQVQADLKY